MTFTGNEGSPISIDTWNQWTSNYDAQQTKSFPGKTVIKACFFGSEKIKQLLAEPEAVGIRIYFGVDDKGEDTVMLVAARADMSDILPDGSSSSPIILDDNKNCPPYCP